MQKEYRVRAVLYSTRVCSAACILLSMGPRAEVEEEGRAGTQYLPHVRLDKQPNERDVHIYQSDSVRRKKKNSPVSNRSTKTTAFRRCVAERQALLVLLLHELGVDLLCLLPPHGHLHGLVALERFRKRG